jgi:uncharacterized glyoxalase superfamily protein PhnB
VSSGGSASRIGVGRTLAKKEFLQCEKGGAKIIKPAQKTFWGGYAGYFQDLDGHLWEIGHNPSWKIEE